MNDKPKPDLAWARLWIRGFAEMERKVIQTRESEKQYREQFLGRIAS